MPVPQKATAFEISVDEIRAAKSPEPLRKKFTTSGPKQTSLSKEDLSEKLKSASARKEKGDQERSTKAGAVVSHAQKVAKSTKQEIAQKEEEAKTKIAEKFNAATQARENELAKQREKAGAHNVEVKSRFIAASQEGLAAGATDIESKLSAAEERRLTAENDRKSKLSDHFAKVESARNSNSPAKLGQAITAKISAAETRRQQEITDQQSKLAARHDKVQQAREQKRKLGASNEHLNASELQSRPKIPRD